MRKLFHVGTLHTISFAVEADGVTSPAEDALKLMLTGMWAADPEAAKEGLPSDTQIDRRAQLVAGIKYFARHGVPSQRSCGVNALQSGIWEFKEGQKRVSFFDTDGHGSFTEKRKFKNPALADYPNDPHWDIPGFDQDIRLGHCFGKPWGQRTTEQEDLDETIRVREEDLSHDRAA